MPKQVALTDDEFRDAFRAGTAPEDAQLRKGFIADITDAGGDTRSLDFVISTSSVDRAGDTVSVNGWKLDNFKRNPVILWSHDATMMPIAKASNIRVEDGKLKARAEFMPREMSGFADAVYRALKAGFLSATSVGFSPTKYKFSDDTKRAFGIDFMEQELLEFSVCAIPCNPDALVESRSASKALAGDSPLREWVNEVMAKAGLATLPTKRLEAIMGLPEKFRSLANGLPEKAKGARGQLIRCANMAERQITSDAEIVLPEDDEPTEAVPPVEVVKAEDPPVVEAVATPRLAMARRRLEMARRQLG